MQATTKDRLSQDLWRILDFELSRGNTIKEELIEQWEGCPYQILLQNPMDIPLALREGLPETVTTFYETDPHYPAQAGFYSKVSRHLVTGPHPYTRR